jgi:hypothetical protein
MRPLLIFGGALWVLLGEGAGGLVFCQEAKSPVPTATVKVVAVNVEGDPLSRTDVYSFVDENGAERVGLFKHDHASGVPYGKYRMSVQANGGFREETFFVLISAPDVLVTAALQWYGVENDLGGGRFSGRIIGQIPWSVGLWCKAAGLYSREQFESEVSAMERTFDFGEVPGGCYVLTCVSDRKTIVVQRVLRIWASGPFKVEYNPSQELDSRQ